jgi:PEP-CTERM motif
LCSIYRTCFLSRPFQGSLRNRAVILVILLLAFGCVASADTVYNVSGTFGTFNPFSGPLNGGSFDGTFSAILPITTDGTYISEFSISQFNSSGAEIGSITSSTAGSVAVVQLEPTSVCGVGPSTSGPCDVFNFHGGPWALQLATPLDLTGGHVYPFFFGAGGTGSLGSFRGFLVNTSIVTSGSIEPAAAVPEPSSLLLFGLVTLGFLCVGRNRLLAAGSSFRDICERVGTVLLRRAG